MKTSPRSSRLLWRAARKTAGFLALSAAGWVACAGAADAPNALNAPNTPNVLNASGSLTTQNLPALGDTASEEIDIVDERRLGERVMRDIHRDPDYLDDPLLLEYLNHLWQPLLQAARNRGDITPDLERAFAWDVFLVRDRTVNAFALPGGYVGVHLGLIAMTTAADELASVLAHELSHVTQRHIARGMANSQRQSVASTAAMILGILLAARTSSLDAAQAVMIGGQAVAMQGQLNFSREMEREADRIGWQVLNSAGFAPSGMTAMFEKLEAGSRLNDSNQYPYLRSHPLTIERIAEARLRAPADAAATAPGPLAEHALMQARARALMEPSEPALRRMQSVGTPGSPQVGAGRVGALYGAALAALLLRDAPGFEQASAAGLALVNERFAQQPNLRRAFELLRLQALAERTQAQAASQALQGALGHDESRPALLVRAQAALAGQRGNDPRAAEALRQSVQALQAWVVEHRSDAQAWQALSQCAQALGMTLRSQRAAAEATAAQGDVLGAVERMRVAQQTARNEPAADYVEASIIQSRLRELEAERRRLMAEARGQAGQ